jgi:hypothetical protein
MHPKLPDKRVIAVALRSRRFAFAIFEGPYRLLDWGTVFYPLNNAAQHAAAKKRIVSLLTMITPSVVVIRKARLLNSRKGSGARPILAAIKRAANSRSVPVRPMKPREISEVFQLFQATTKYEIASMLAESFPHLSWKLPPVRKIWESEHPRMALFDAVALGFAYWHKISTGASATE